MNVVTGWNLEMSVEAAHRLLDEPHRVAPEERRNKRDLRPRHMSDNVRSVTFRPTLLTVSPYHSFARRGISAQHPVIDTSGEYFPLL